MLSDARHIPDGTRLDTDVCIIGGGPAGITLAVGLAGGDLRICLLESGGLHRDASVAALDDFTTSGISIGDRSTYRHRNLGGASSVWAGRCLPLGDEVLEPRPWIAERGWPIDRAELDRYYAAAAPLCRVGRLPQDGPLPVPDEERFDPGVFQLIPSEVGSAPDFGRQHRRELRTLRNLTVHHHATVLELEPSADVTSIGVVRAGTTTGRRFDVHARHVVLAGGGLENARLLLGSGPPADGGLGNAHGNVGRYFADHPYLLFRIWAPQPIPAAVPWYRGRGPARHGLLALSPGFCRAEGLPAAAAYARPLSPRAGASAGLTAARSLRRALRSRDVSTARGALGGVLRHPWSVAEEMRRRSASRRDLRQVEVNLVVEPVPRADSRVSLGTARDPWGNRRLDVDWRMGSREERAAHRFRELLLAELARIGRSDVQAEPLPPWPGGIRPAGHHMGTTRMGDRPEAGVVDRHCRVHGIANLHVAGSSVFPTFGVANPTLTVVALALRLADRLRSIVS